MRRRIRPPSPYLLTDADLLRRALAAFRLHRPPGASQPTRADSSIETVRGVRSAVLRRGIKVVAAYRPNTLQLVRVKKAPPGAVW
jgi:hypothetical protein